MEKDMTNLNAIIPENILNSSKNHLFTLGLIRNDFSDIIFFQRLLTDNYKDVRPIISATNGQFTGRRIYILRLALVHFHSFLEFLFKRESQLSNSSELISILEKIDKDDKKLWEDFIILAHKSFNCKEDLFSKLEINPIISKLILLSNAARNSLTSHYYGSSNFINKGFEKAFLSDYKDGANEFAYVTEIESVDMDRAYYIDLSIQRYLEMEVSNGKDLFKIEKEFVKLLALANRIISNILNIYHQDLIKK